MRLEQIEEALRLYVTALSGQEVRLLPGAVDGRRAAACVLPSSDDRTLTLRLPRRVDRFPSDRENFAWYKVIATHQAGHLEFGTLRFALDRPSHLFDDWRPALVNKSSNARAPTDLERLFGLFPNRGLGVAIFEALEDARIDAHALDRYPGIRVSYRRMAEHALAERPSIGTLSARQALVEALVQARLGGDPTHLAPPALEADLQLALALQARVATPTASVEDVAEAALRLYEIAAGLPAVIAEHGRAQVGTSTIGATADARPPDRLRETTDDPAAPDPESPFEIGRRSPVNRRVAEPDAEIDDGATVPPVGESDVASPAGPLTRDDPFCYLYPEWDFRANALRERWCRVREDVLEEASSDFYTRALTEHRWLAGQVQTRLERLLPELFRKMPRRYDGEDLDLDSLVELIVDCRVGTTPSEKIYWRRERTQRDVAVAVLLDMSATTGEYITLKRAHAGRPAVISASAYSQYLARLTAGVDERGKPLRKRTVDIEKEAAIVLMQALERIGDSYALYAFSGSGRDEVEFHVIKDFQELLGQQVARRIDSVAPAHATRMGAAIRHATRKLERVEAHTRLLFLLSDGRPYDRDYGRDEDDLDYAVHDTRQALREATRRKIRPFCLTIDQHGADYLQQMCDDVPYEVVVDVEELPLRLSAVYPRLTA